MVDIDPERAFREFTHRHIRPIRSALRRWGADQDAVDELTIDVFRVAFAKFDSLDGLTDDESLRWLRGTARRLLANRWRRTTTQRRLIQQLAAEPVEIVLSVEEGYLEVEAATDLSARLAAALEQVRADLRLVLWLDAQGVKGPQIAERLGVSHAVARKRLMNARSALKASYRDVVASRVHQGGS